MWFDGWFDVLRVAMVGPLAYGVLVACLRFSGKRTLAQLNAFDFVVTVAIGSTLATVVLSADVAFAEGAFGLMLLVGLQYIVATVSRRIPAVRRMVKSQPRVLVRNGVVLHEVLRHERLSVDEVHQALRQSGIAEVADVAAVVLETNGTLSVLTHAADEASALVGVSGWGAPER